MEFWVDEFAYSKWGRIRIPIGFGFGTLPQDAKSDQQNYYILHVNVGDPYQYYYY